MRQEDLWHESIEDALRSIVEATGGPKATASEMWPTKRIADAARHLNHCLDIERPEKLSLSEVMFIARRGRDSEVHTLMHYLATELGYETPRPVDPRDEHARMQAEFKQTVELQEKILRHMERLAAATTSRPT